MCRNLRPWCFSHCSLWSASATSTCTECCLVWWNSCFHYGSTQLTTRMIGILERTSSNWTSWLLPWNRQMRSRKRQLSFQKEAFGKRMNTKHFYSTMDLVCSKASYADDIIIISCYYLVQSICYWKTKYRPNSLVWLNWRLPSSWYWLLRFTVGLTSATISTNWFIWPNLCGSEDPFGPNQLFHSRVWTMFSWKWSTVRSIQLFK